MGEKARRHIRWLRPDDQNPTDAQAAKGKTTEMNLGTTAKVEKAPWPKSLPSQRCKHRLTGALLDRLTHHVNILEMNGESYRINQSEFRRAKNESVLP